jgi:hypothetical protein
MHLLLKCGGINRHGVVIHGHSWAKMHLVEEMGLLANESLWKVGELLTSAIDLPKILIVDVGS